MGTLKRTYIVELWTLTGGKQTLAAAAASYADVLSTLFDLRPYWNPLQTVLKLIEIKVTPLEYADDSLVAEAHRSTPIWPLLSVADVPMTHCYSCGDATDYAAIEVIAGGDYLAPFGMADPDDAAYCGSYRICKECTRDLPIQFYREGW